MHFLEQRLWRRLEALSACRIDQYAGNAGSYPITVGLVDDSDAPNASNFNVAPQGLCDRTAYLTARVGLAGFDWKPRIAVSSLPDAGGGGQTFAGCAAWNAATSLWMFGFGNTATDAAYLLATAAMDPQDLTTAEWPLIGSGAVYTAGGGVSCRPVACSADPNGVGVWCAVDVPSLSEVQIQFAASSSAAWNNVRTVASSDTASMCTFGGYLIYLADSGVISSTANQGSTWSDFNTGLSGASSRCAVGPSAVVFAAGHFVWTSTDGHTWSNAINVGSGSSITIAGLAWDATRQLFVACVRSLATGDVPQFWTSPDGLTWTESSSGPAGQVPVDFTVFNGDWVCTLADLTSGGVGPQMVSFDKGATWFLGRASTPTNSTSTTLTTQGRLATSPIQLCTFNTLWVRFSQLAGLPAVHL